MRQIDIILRYELGVNPDEYDDEQWATLYSDLVWYLQQKYGNKNSFGF